MKINNVLDGWRNFISKSEVSEDLAKQRAKHCAVCPHLKTGALLVFVKDKPNKEIQGTYCDICTCPTSAKIRALNESCDDNPSKW